MAWKRLKGVEWTGLDSFKQELEVLALNLVDEAEAILTESAFAAMADIKANYPFKSGALRDGLVIRPLRGITLAGCELRQTAPHGWIYENGTRPRYNKAGAFRGVMPGNRIFEPTAQAYRRTAISSIVFWIYQQGATRVTGEAYGEPVA